MILTPYCIQDGAEIVFFATIFYYFSLWLSKDKQHNLVWFFYGYLILFCGSYAGELHILSSFLFFFSPAIVTLFIVVHQDTLQKNLVAYKPVLKLGPLLADWIKTVIQVMLITVNRAKEMHCIIEGNDSLEQFLETSFALHTPCNSDVFKLLTESQLYNQNSFIWINKNGIIKGINCTFKQNRKIDPSFLTTQEISSIYTSKTDALVLSITPGSGTFSLIKEGSVTQQIPADRIYTLLYQHITRYSLTPQKDMMYENPPQKNSTREHTP